MILFTSLTEPTFPVTRFDPSAIRIFKAELWVDYVDSEPTDAEIIAWPVSPYVTITSLSDFPAPVGNVITLEDGKAYQLVGTIDLGLNRIECGAKNTISGRDRTNDRLISSTTSALITCDSSVTVKQILTIDNVTLHCTNGSLFNFTSSTAANQVLIVNNCTLMGCVSLGNIHNATSVLFRNTAFRGPATVNGLTITNTVNSGTFTVRDCNFNTISGTTFNFGTSIWSTIVIARCQISTASGTTFLTGTTNSANVLVSGKVEQNIFSGSGTYISTLTNLDSKWSWLDNFGVDNSDILFGVNGVETGRIGARSTGTFLARSQSGIYDPNDGGVLASAGKLTVGGGVTQLNSLAGSSNREVRVDAAGQLYTVDIAPIAWTLSDTSTDTYLTGTGTGQGSWVQLATLFVTVGAGEVTTSGTRIEAYVRLQLENVTANRSGVINIGFGLNGAFPTSVGQAVSIAPGFTGPVSVSFASTTATLNNTDVISIWIQRQSGDNAAFGVSATGSLSTGHYFELTRPSNLTVNQALLDFQPLSPNLSLVAAIPSLVLSGDNTGDQTSIVGITGTLAQFNTALIDADFASGGGIVTGTSSGTNTGDQTITLTGHVTGSGVGSFATTISAGVVTLAMQANMPTSSVVYRKTAGSGPPETQTLATLKADLDLTGINTGDQDLSPYATISGVAAGYQPLDSDLTAIAALTGSDIIYYRSAPNTWSAVTIGANILFSSGVLSAVSFTEVTKNLGAASRSGTFDITGLSGLTPDKPVIVSQAASPITSKGNARDELEMDQIQASGYVLNSTTIRVYWSSPSIMVGNYNFSYLIGA